MSRYQVTELFGYRTTTTGGGGGGIEPGLSVHVIDTLWNRRIMGSWRSEDFGGHTRAESKLRARRAARALADQLNGSG